jgi:hypothetical protein
MFDLINNIQNYDDGDSSRTLLEINEETPEVDLKINTEIYDSGSKLAIKDDLRMAGDDLIQEDSVEIKDDNIEEVNVPKDKVKVIMSNLTFVPGAQGLPQILMNEYIASINSYFDKLNISIPEVKFEVNNNSQYGYINVATGVSVTLINPELSVLALYDFMKIYNLTNVHFCKED